MNFSAVFNLLSNCLLSYKCSKCIYKWLANNYFVHLLLCTHLYVTLAPKTVSRLLDVPESFVLPITSNTIGICNLVGKAKPGWPCISQRPTAQRSSPAPQHLPRLSASRHGLSELDWGFFGLGWVFLFCGCGGVVPA